MQINRSTAPHRCQHGARTQQGQHRAAVIAKAAALRTVDKEFLNPIGVHALVYAGDWSEASARTVAAGAVAANFNLVEIAAFSAAKLDAAMTKSVLEEHGLQAACSLGLTLNSDVSSDQPDVVQRGLAELDAALSFAAAIGAKHLCGILYSALAKYPSPPKSAGRENAIQAIRSLAAKAADKDIKVCLEVVNRYETNLLNTAGQAMQFIQEVQHDNVYVHLDTYHMHIEESGFEQAVLLCGEKLGYVHIGESHRGYLGSGQVDFQGLFRGLAAISYSGPITFESFSSEVVSTELSNNLCVWRNMWSQSQLLARHARAFIEQQLISARVAALQEGASTPSVRQVRDDGSVLPAR